MMNVKKFNSTIKYGYRFGQIAILKGFITEQQFEEVLDEQINCMLNAAHKLIGEILLEKGWMTQDQIAIVLDNLSNSKIFSSNYLKYISK